MKKKLRLTANTSIFHTRQDLKVIIDYCNQLADENELLKDRILKLEQDLKDTKVWNHLN